LITIALF